MRNADLTDIYQLPLKCADVNLPSIFPATFDESTESTSSSHETDTGRNPDYVRVVFVPTTFNTMLRLATRLLIP